MRFILRLFFMLICIQSSAQNMSTYTYAVKATDSLKLDIYTPNDLKTNQKRPVVIWMHGGGFSGGSRSNVLEQKMMTYLANNGFIGVSISYRLLRKGTETGFGCECSKEAKLFTFANAAEDFLDATNFIIKHSDSLHIDVSKIVAGGSSAGAEAVLSAVYMKDYFIENTSAYNSINYAGLISFAGAMVDETYITKENAIPTILFHGTKDNLVPYAKAAHHFCKIEDPGFLILNGSEGIYKQLEKLNTAYYLFRVENGQHEVASSAFYELEVIVDFIRDTVIDSKVIQTKRLEIKK